MFLVCPPQSHWHFKFGELLLALFLHTYLLICLSLKDTKYFFVCAHVCLKYICYSTLPFSSNLCWKTVLGLHTYETSQWESYSQDLGGHHISSLFLVHANVWLRGKGPPCSNSVIHALSTLGLRCLHMWLPSLVASRKGHWRVARGAAEFWHSRCKRAENGGSTWTLVVVCCHRSFQCFI